jgi:sugar lactone lactonase YvrE
MAIGPSTVAPWARIGFSRLEKQFAGLLLLAACVAPMALHAQTAHLQSVQTIITSTGPEEPAGNAVDSAGNVYMVDIETNSLYKYTPSDSGYTQTVLAGEFFHSPSGVAVDSSGNLYITDNTQNNIWKATPSNGSYSYSMIMSGTTDGMSNPGGIAVDSSGNLYIADTNNNRVLKETLSNGSYTQSVLFSGLSNPASVAVDSSNNIYIADTFNGRVLKETVSGSTYTQTTIGSGVPYPYAVAVDSSGNVYIGDTNNQRVLKETLSGGTYTQQVIGSGIEVPDGISVDSSGNVYISDGAKLDMVKEAVTTAANFGSVLDGTTSKAQTMVFQFDTAGKLSAAPFVSLQGVSGLDYLDSLNGTCTSNGTSHSYVVGEVCSVTVTFTPSRSGGRYGGVVLLGSSSTVIAGVYLEGDGSGPQLAFLPGANTPLPTDLNNRNGGGYVQEASLNVDANGDVYYYNGEYAEFEELVFSGGSYTLQANIPPITDLYSETECEYLHQNYPPATTLDGSGNFYISYNDCGNIFKQTLANKAYSPSLAGTTETDNEVAPSGLAVDGSGNLYVGLPDQHVVVKYIWNGTTYSPSTIATGLGQPSTVAVDISGNVYVGDRFDGNLFKYTLSGSTYTQSTVANGFTGTGLASIAVDTAGDVYVADIYTSIVYKETPTSGGYTQSTFWSGGAYVPYCVALDGNGSLYIEAFIPNLAVTNAWGTAEIVKMDVSTDAGGLIFSSRAVGTTSAPVTIALDNVGNANLAFSMTSTGVNPSISANFVYDISSTCPQSANGGTLGIAGTCSQSIDFAPTEVGSIAGSMIITDNNLNTAATQTVPLSGVATAGTKTITFPSPGTPIALGSTVTMAATASNGDAVTYTITAGTATVSGSTITFTTAGTVTIAANSAATSTYNAAPTVSDTVTVDAVPATNSGGSVNVGSTANNLTAYVQILAENKTTNATLGTAIQVSAEGATGQDYTYVSGGTCAANKAYSQYEVCTVKYDFTPKAPGERLGAVVLYSNDSTPVVLGTAFLSGTGVSPLPLFSSGVTTTYATAGYATDGAIDGNGNLYIGDSSGTGNLVKIPAGGGAPTTLAANIGAVAGVGVDGAGNVFYAVGSIVYEIYGGTGAAFSVIGAVQPDNSLIFDQTGNFYVELNSAGAIWKYNPEADTGSEILQASGRVIGMTIDASNNLYYADFQHGTLYKIPSGSTTPTLLTSVGMSEPDGVAIDAAGNIYVSNYGASPTNGIASLIKIPVGCTTTACQTALATGFSASFTTMDAQGNLYVGNLTAGQVMKISRVAAPALAFATTPAGTTEHLTVGYENDGTAALTISGTSSSNSSFLSGTGTTCVTSMAIGATCNLDAEFAPLAIGTVSGTLGIVDNALNVSGQTQSVSVSGSATQGSKIITFPQPASPVFANTSTSLTATASGGDPVTYSITSGPATLNGATVTYTGPGTVVIAADSAATVSYTAAATVSVSVTVAASSISTAPTEPVGTASAAQMAYVTFTTQGTLATISVLTQGATNLDYNSASGGTCTIGTLYYVGDVCTVGYTFKPTAPWIRRGGISLSDGSGVLLANGFINGIGTGPQVGFTVTSPTVLPSVLGIYSTPFNLSIDGSGNVYVVSYAYIFGLQEIIAVNGAIPASPAIRNITLGYGTSKLAFDGSGNAFAVDDDNNNLIEIVAVGGVIPSSPTVLTLAPLSSNVNGIAIDGSGNIFLAEPQSGLVQEVLAVNGTIPASPTIKNLGSGWGAPFDVAVDASGDVFVADFSLRNVYEMVPVNGVISTTTPSSIIGSGLTEPGGIALDGAGDVYVSDYQTNVVSEIVASNGAVSSTSKVNTLGSGFSTLRNLAVDAGGNVYVDDYGNNAIKEISVSAPPSLTFASTVNGSTSSDSPQTVTITNLGSSTLTNTGLSLSPNFTLSTGSGDCTASSSLAAGASCTLGIAFTPVAPANATVAGSAVLTNNNLDSTVPQQTVVLNGTSVPEPPTIGSVSPTSGSSAGGSTIAIHGTNFVDVTAVSFGSSPVVSYSGVSSTLISAITPGGAIGAVDVTVTTTGGSTTLTSGFTYVTPTFGGLAVSGFSSPAILTEGGSITVSALDMNGTVYPGFTGTVTLTSSDAKATLPAAYTFTSADNGVHVFTVTLNTIGTQSITATNGSTTGSQTGIMVGDAIWVLSTVGTLEKLNVGGGVVSSGVGTSGTATELGGVAFDATGNAWSVNSGLNAVSYASSLGLGTTNYTGGGLSSPVAVAVDGAGVIWVANSGNNTVSAFTNAGVALSGTTGIGTSDGLSSPSAVAIDEAGTLWIANKGSNTVTRVFGGVTPVTTPLSTATTNGTLGTAP